MIKSTNIESRNETLIVAIIPFYNDFKALQRLLMNLSSMGMPSILCDGRFHNFQKIDESDFSTDGSRFLVQGFKDAILINCGPCYVDEKINALLDEAEKQGYSHSILLGSDENIEGSIKLLKKELEKISGIEPLLISLPFEEKNPKLDKPPKFIERVFFMPGQIRAKGNYQSFYSVVDQANGISPPMKSNPVSINAITIHHDSTIRTKERNELMKNYQREIKEKNTA